MSAPARAYPRYATPPAAAARDRALATLARLPTTTGDGRPASVRTLAVFGRAPTGIAIPLNRKTTQQAITTIPLEDLEPRQEFVPVQGLESYIVQPRRDPPDVARVQMRDGTERLLVQEGHTRLGAAILRGDHEMPVRVWEFVQMATGGFEPVARGRERIGQRHRDKLRSLAQTFSLPDIADVSFPSMIGAIPSKPKRTPVPPRKKRRKPVHFRGVTLSRAPMQFEMDVLSLAEIPPRLDAAVAELQNPETSLFVTLSDLARFGALEVLKELVRQGAPESILMTPPNCDAAVRALATQVQTDRTADLDGSRHNATAKVDQRRIPPHRKAVLVQELTDRYAPGLLKRHAARAVNMAFALGRATVIDQFRRQRGPLDLASSKEGKLISGTIWVDAVIQTAVMDTSTCDECEDVDGEVMELGDDRQQELHPPYVKCFGGDRCRCLQIALLSDGSEINVDDVPEEAYEDEEF